MRKVLMSVLAFAAIVLSSCGGADRAHQLKVLKKANLVSTHKEGTKVYYKLADEHVNSLLKVVQQHAEE